MIAPEVASCTTSLRCKPWKVSGLNTRMLSQAFHQ